MDLISLGNLTPLSYQNYAGRTSFCNLAAVRGHQYTDVLLAWVDEAKERSQTGAHVVWLTDPTTPKRVMRALQEASGIHVYDQTTRGVWADVLYVCFYSTSHFQRYVEPLLDSERVDALVYVHTQDDVEWIGDDRHWITPPVVPERPKYSFTWVYERTEQPDAKK